MADLVELATLGGGCFWCVEAPLLELEGVLKVESGYSGGHVPNPTYEQVCTKTTGHVEVVQVTFDPAKLSYQDLLEVFFTIHDPTTKDRQGNDSGPQYRSAIFTHSEDQHRLAEKLIQDWNEKKIFSSPIVTVVEPITNYFPAEDYHQNYFNENSFQPYCQFVIAPKLIKFREKFASKRKKTD
jgi:peptide-methionine (S)-S-oxide reductase